MLWMGLFFCCLFSYVSGLGGPPNNIFRLTGSPPWEAFRRITRSSLVFSRKVFESRDSGLRCSKVFNWRIDHFKRPLFKQGLFLISAPKISAFGLSVAFPGIEPRIPSVGIDPILHGWFNIDRFAGYRSISSLPMVQVHFFSATNRTLDWA